jgi:tRNA(Ile)-lysidine synthase
MLLCVTLERFFRLQARVTDGDLLLVAFSGGPDSTALIWGLSQVGARQRFRIHAIHLDHGLDPGSTARAQEAARIADHLSIPITTRKLPLQDQRRGRDGAEALARHLRYQYLEEARRELDARYVATGHHRDDQAETVLLRILFGSGVEGLGGIRPVQGHVVRPLLELPRAELAAALGGSGIQPVEDPTNRNLLVPRNWVRLRLLPVLASEQPSISEDLARLARFARGASWVTARRLRNLLQPVVRSDEVAVERQQFEALAAPLQRFALSLLHRLARAPYPAGRAARAELLRQMGSRGRVGCDCGKGWRWEDRGGLLVLRRRRPATPLFTYTLDIPGELEVPELSLTIRLTRGKYAYSALEDRADRVELALPLGRCHQVIIRNRRAGDRIQPSGSRRIRRLKEILIDRKIPREERDQIPLLCVGDQIAWVPGVTVDERFRPRRGGGVWTAELSRQKRGIPRGQIWL